MIHKNINSIAYVAFGSCDSLTKVFYIGTSEEFNHIEISSGNNAFKNATVYYYSETEPTDSGNYWHYDEDGKTPVIWAKKEIST